ncbi:MAG TPA: hypothetical protein VIG24_18400 [Acidimicrobiia bacterium]
MADTIHQDRNRRRAEHFGLVESSEEAPEAPSMSNTKDELLAAAEVAGLDVDETNTKAEILEALEG